MVISKEAMRTGVNPLHRVFHHRRNLEQVCRTPWEYEHYRSYSRLVNHGTVDTEDPRGDDVIDQLVGDDVWVFVSLVFFSFLELKLSLPFSTLSTANSVVRV